MRAIRSKNTRPELTVRSALHALGYRYRVHDTRLHGSPDIVFWKRRKIILIHGCFWHMHGASNCSNSQVPKTNVEYWRPKLERNKQRDQENQRLLEQEGWDVRVVWECQTLSKEHLISQLMLFLGPP